MTKSDIIDAVSKDAGLSKAEAKKAVEFTFEAIKNGVAQDGKVQVQGFGTFKSVHREARVGRNPQNGQPIEIAAKNVTKFTSSF